MNRILVLICLMATLLFSFTGCGSKEIGQNVSETAEIKLVVRAEGGSYDNFSTHYIEEKTNTKLNITPVPSNELDKKINLILASGDRPDIIQYHTMQIEYDLQKSKLLLPISDYFAQYPNIEKSRTQEYWNAMKHDDGKAYAVSAVTSLVQYIPTYRKDWLDKLNLSIPKTIDEYYNVANAVTNNDPDGNGKNDTFALGSPGWITLYFDHIFGAFGTLPICWIEKDGQLVNGSVMPEAKEALKFLNKMYMNGMIDPEFITDTEDRVNNKLKSGIYGAMNGKVWLYDTNNTNNYYKPFKDKNPNGEYAEGPLPTLDGKENIGIRSASVTGWIRSAIISKTKNKDGALRVLDFLSSDEGNMFHNYGIEGEHYIKNAGGTINRTVDSTKSKEFGILQLFLARKALFMHTSESYNRIAEKAEGMAYKLPEDGIYISEMTQYQNDLSNLVTDNYFRMITGGIQIDGGFENFVEEWKSKGGERLTKQFNEKYKERMSKGIQ